MELNKLNSNYEICKKRCQIDFSLLAFIFLLQIIEMLCRVAYESAAYLRADLG